MHTKRKYFTPKVQEISLDNEIFILMTSTPPGDPFKSICWDSKEGIANDPYA